MVVNSLEVYADITRVEEKIEEMLKGLTLEHNLKITSITVSSNFSNEYCVSIQTKDME